MIIMQRDEIIKLLYFVWIGIIIFIPTPLSIYYLIRFWRLKDKVPTFHKRHPKLVTFIIICILIHILIIRTIADLPGILDHPLNNDLSTFYVRLILWYTIHIIYITLIIRAWLLYIDYTQNEQLITLSWQQQIVHDNIKLPWSLRYKFLSNIKYLSIIAGIYWISIVIAVHTALGYAESHQDFASTASYVIIWLFTIIIAYKIRKCKDELFIHIEVKCMAIIITIMIPTTFLMFQWLDRGKLLALAITVFLDICLFTMIIIMTRFIEYKYTQKMDRQSVEKRMTENISLKTILGNKDGFDLFAHHLVKEFSIEHLTFLFEIMQLKYDIIDNGLINEEIDKNGDDINLGIMFKIGEFYMKKIRRNTYKFETTSAVNVYERLAFLMYNYVDLNGDYSINISAKIRNKLMNKMEDIMIEYDYMEKSNSMLTRSFSRTYDAFAGINIDGKHEMISSQEDIHNEMDEICVIGIKKNKNVIVDEGEKEKMVKYFKLMDIVIEDVLQMLSSDSYHRFMQTKKFQKLIESNPSLKKQ